MAEKAFKTTEINSILIKSKQLLTGCSEDAGVPSAPPDTPSGLLLRGTMPGGGDATRAYVDGKGGFFWNAADTVMVTDSYYSSYGAMFTGTFSASPGSDGQKTATFQVDLADTPAGDINQYLVPWLLQGATDYYAIFPKTLGMGDDPALGATYNYSFPATQVQSGASSRHLAKYMLMTSGKVDIDRSGSGGSLAQEGSLVRLPDFSLTHRTSLMRLRVLNRQANPIDVRRVSVSARRADGSTDYFKAGCSYYVLADSVKERGGAYATLAVELRGDDGSPGCAVAGGGELSAYAAMLPNATGGVEFTFEVETTEALYKTLAFPGDRIQGARFEAGKYYTFELLVDHGLSVQAWEADRLDDISFLRSLASCRAYATTAGFESVCEAMYFGKPILMVPAHIEQDCNAYDACRCGAGITARDFDLGRLVSFAATYSPSAEFRPWAESCARRMVPCLEKAAETVPVYPLSIAALRSMIQ